MNYETLAALAAAATLLDVLSRTAGRIYRFAKKRRSAQRIARKEAAPKHLRKN